MNMDIQHLNILLEALSINEMAEISGKIRVDNEDKTNNKGETLTKFPHYHWLSKENIHFKFANRCPKNITELKSTIAFKKEKEKISDKELTKLLKVLKSPASEPEYNGMTVYEAGLEYWKFIHPKRLVELIIL